MGSKFSRKTINAKYITPTRLGGFYSNSMNSNWKIQKVPKNSCKIKEKLIYLYR